VLFAHNSAAKPVWLHFEVDAVGRPGAAGSISTFSLFSGDAFESKGWGS